MYFIPPPTWVSVVDSVWLCKHRCWKYVLTLVLIQTTFFITVQTKQVSLRCCGSAKKQTGNGGRVLRSWRGHSLQRLIMSVQLKVNWAWDGNSVTTMRRLTFMDKRKITLSPLKKEEKKVVFFVSHSEKLTLKWSHHNRIM